MSSVRDILDFARRRPRRARRDCARIRMSPLRSRCSSRRSACSRAATANRRPSSDPRRLPRSQRPPPQPPAAPSRISAEWSRPPARSTATTSARVVAEIADDRYMGRAPGSPGDKMTRAYLEKELAKRGFEPGARRRVVGAAGRARRRHVDAAREVDVRARRRTRRRSTRNTDFIAASGVQAARACGRRRRGRVRRLRHRGARVRLGRLQGRRRARQGAADAQQRSRTGIRRCSRAPNASSTDAGSTSTRARRGTARPARSSFTRRRRRAIRGTRRAGVLGRAAVQAAGRRRAARAGRRLDHRGGGAPAARRPTADLDALVEQAKRRDFKPVPLGITTSIALRNTLTRTQSANVLGILRGSDPRSPTSS